MKGVNELRFNRATMAEVVQLYLDKTFAGKAPRVKGVSFINTDVGYFNVIVEGDGIDAKKEVDADD